MLIDIVSVGIHSAYKSPMEVAFCWGHLLSFACVIIYPSSQHHEVSSAMLLLYRWEAWHISWHMTDTSRKWQNLDPNPISLSKHTTDHLLLMLTVFSCLLVLYSKIWPGSHFFEKSLAWCSSQRAPVKRSKSKCFRQCDCILSCSHSVLPWSWKQPPTIHW